MADISKIKIPGENNTYDLKDNVAREEIGLLADITYYVDATNGSDSNDGLTTATAFKTIQKALNTPPLRLNNHLVTISLAPGDYRGDGTAITCSRNFLNGSIYIKGDSNVTIDTDTTQSSSAAIVPKLYITTNGWSGRGNGYALVLEKLTFEYGGQGDNDYAINTSWIRNVRITSCVVRSGFVIGFYIKYASSFTMRYNTNYPNRIGNCTDSAIRCDQVENGNIQGANILDTNAIGIYNAGSNINFDLASSTNNAPRKTWSRNGGITVCTSARSGYIDGPYNVISDASGGYDPGTSYTNDPTGEGKYAFAHTKGTYSVRNGKLIKFIKTVANENAINPATDYVETNVGNEITNNIHPIITEPLPENVYPMLNDILTFTVNAVGDEPLAYKWQYSDDGGVTWTDLSSTSNALQVTFNSNAKLRRQYRCKVTGNSGKTIYSNVVRVNGGQSYPGYKQFTIEANSSKTYDISNISRIQLTTFSSQEALQTMLNLVSNSSGVITITDYNASNHAKISFNSSVNNKLTVTNSDTSSSANMYALIYQGSFSESQS